MVIIGKKIEKKAKAEYSGQQNIARLAKNLLDFSTVALVSTLEIDDVTKLDDHDEFHDFRKTLRSIDFVCTFQDDPKTGTIFKSTFTDKDVILGQIYVIYDKFGTLNDAIVSYLHNVENGVPVEKLHEQKLALEGVWASLKSYLQEAKYFEVVGQLEEGFIDYSEPVVINKLHRILEP